MFDELLGFAQQGPGFTATLTIRYLRPTPLNRLLKLRASVERIDGRNARSGSCELDGTVLAEAEGLIALPRGAATTSSPASGKVVESARAW